MAFLSQLQKTLLARKAVVEETAQTSTGYGGASDIVLSSRAGDVAGAAGAAARYYTARDFEERNETGLAGLANQGATCYLNSLLQALFMTPEFRAAVYAWDRGGGGGGGGGEGGGGGKGGSSGGGGGDGRGASSTANGTKARPAPLPLALQRLFARLQLGKRRSATTGGLTRAFGWTGQEAFMQQDVQECLQELFRALSATAGVYVV